MTTPEPTILPRQNDFDVPPETFHPSVWVNAALSSHSIPTLLESLTTSVNSSHETFSASLKTALTSIPWVVRETERIRQRANLLRTNIDGVGLRVAGVESAVISSVKTIADADTVLKRVQETVQLLQTALHVETLLTRLDALLASTGADGADLVAAADVIAQLREALAPLESIQELSEKRDRLKSADATLQQLAVPQLRSALETRNASAARNARIVFDHAGRGDAFRQQYGQLRAGELREAWTRAWKRDEEGDVTGAGDLASVNARIAVDAFYTRVAELVDAEREWVKDAFPDLASLLLPALLRKSVDGLSPAPAVNVFGAGDVAARLFDVAICSVQATAKITGAILPKGFMEMEGAEGEEAVETVDAEQETDAELLSSIADSITALLLPFRKFWDVNDQVAVRQARTRSNEIEIATAGPESGVSLTRPPLSDLAKDIETVAKESVYLLDDLMGTINTRTCGVGITAMKQAGTTVAAVLSDRLLRILRRSAGKGGDEWTRINGALRLLIATSSLKRAWDTRKESSFAVAVGTATPVLEVASLVQNDPARRIRQFITQVQAGNEQEAAIVWELMRRNGLPHRIVSEFESLDSENDFQGLVDTVHRIVYENMFNGVKERFASFSGRDLWSGEGGDADAAMLGFSSSPLGYATEVADYLMTIPQQLEPFIPDEDDAKYATPRSPYLFSKTKTARGTDEEDDLLNMSFAGMWISALTIGTMELFVEKICSLTRLSESGTRQLATDADYIINVVASLGVAPTTEMSLLCKLLESSRDAQAFAQAAEGHSGEHRKLIRRVGAVRGINVTV